jgi:hypothetical protein
MVEDEHKMDIELKTYTPIWFVLFRWLDHKKENKAVSMYLCIFTYFLFAKFKMAVQTKLKPIGTNTAIK